MVFLMSQQYAPVAELAYARRLERRSRKGLEVQILSGAPNYYVIHTPVPGYGNTF